jgi:hypothetical protein
MKAILFLCATLSTGAIYGMQDQFYKMTIENQLYAKMFLNVPNPAMLTDQSPYPYIKSGKTKTFLLSQEEIANQTIAFPGGYPSNKVQLPIEAKETHFIIKKNPECWQKTIVEDASSKKVISELMVLCNSQK